MILIVFHTFQLNKTNYPLFLMEHAGGQGHLNIILQRAQKGTLNTVT